MRNQERAVLRLRTAGVVLVSCVFTLSAGYFLGDRGYRWFPHTVDLLLICLFAGLCCLLAATVRSGVTKTTGRGRRLRKRVPAFCLLLAVAPAIHLVGCQMQKPVPLTSLTTAEFETMVAAHLEQIDSLDREMESLVQEMESYPAFTTRRGRRGALVRQGPAGGLRSGEKRGQPVRFPWG